MPTKDGFLRHHVPLFASLTDAQLDELNHDLVPRRYTKDDPLFHQSDNNHDLYIVHSGRVRIIRCSPDGYETTLNIYSKGDIIGEFAALDDGPRSATARTLTRCTMLEMPQDRFLHHMRHMPELALAVSRLLVNKLRWTTDYAETVSRYDAAGRLLHILLLYNQRYGVEVEPGKRYKLDLGMTQADLASLVGVNRERVNRILAGWRARGLVDYRARKVTILDLPAAEEERDRRIEAYISVE